MDLFTLLGSLLSLLDDKEYGLNVWIEDLYWIDDLYKCVNVGEFDFNNTREIYVLLNWLMYIVECIYRDSSDIEVTKECADKLLKEIFTVFNYIVKNYVIDYKLTNINRSDSILYRIKYSLESTYISINNKSIHPKVYSSLYIDFLKNLLTMLMIDEEKQKMEKQFYICSSICNSHFSELSSEFWNSEILFITDMSKYVASDSLETKVRMYVDQLVDVYNYNGYMECNYRRPSYRDEPKFVL